MIKTLSQLITPAIKAEEMFDILKGGFSVDAESIPVISQINRKQRCKVENRVIKPRGKHTDGVTNEILYPNDYSIFVALEFAYPIKEISGNLQFSTLNELYENFSGEVIRRQISYLGKAFGFRYSKDGTKEELDKLFLQYEKYIGQLENLRGKMWVDSSFGKWHNILEEQDKRFIEEMRLAYEVYDKVTGDKIEKFRSDFYHSISVSNSYLRNAFDKNKPLINI